LANAEPPGPAQLAVSDAPRLSFEAAAASVQWTVVLVKQ